MRHGARQVDDVRRRNANCADIIVDKCGMPQDTFVKDFRPTC